MEKFNKRNGIFENIKADNSNVMKDVSIKVTLKDNKELFYNKYTLPMEIARDMFKKNADKYIVAKVNGELYDMGRPLESDCELEFLTFDDPDAKQVFWHSSAHLLGLCCELLFGSMLEHGPPTKDGFFYDMDLPIKISQADFEKINTLANKLSKQNAPFERLECTKEDLLIMFSDNPMKLHFINNKIADNTKATVYKCGDLVDLCTGPHIPSLGYIKEFACTNLSMSYWLGNSKNKTLTRIYGISFPDSKQMKKWKQDKIEAEARDHRLIGKNQKLFFFHEYSPGSCFFYPHGVIIYNKLVNFIKNEYNKRGFTEVMTPNMFNIKLWKQSGHWEHYQKNMFKVNVEEDDKSDCSDDHLYALKPMNCPGHCLMFQSMAHSYRDLPIRYADFGVLHRNELKGALTGLTRVRRFQQDDAHIFCEENQVESEINGCIDFLKYVYGIFGFRFSLALSTRPDNYTGTIEIWNKAESQLKKALDNSGFIWTLNPGDGAFYGPKIDITIEDAMGRNHQCATIQLDFNLPNKFNLNYQQSDGSMARPVMIHRAILGSVERMMAILIENYAGKWPFWLSPRQICVIPVDKKFNEYASKVGNIYRQMGFQIDIDLSTDKLNKKIRNSQLEQYNFIFVVGEKEEQSNTVNIRTREGNVMGTFQHNDVLSKLQKLEGEHGIDNVF
ncbi:threonyl-tRNA synthetase [Tupanvirus deep ocean]|uniref:Threonyl-tRNA synthetase n=2 Tax=Tupanvirus TaxID=2094720 RepID=A0AC62AA53_9VIRU|nr:threonyl-tRNA synthetase [Tupanvirus deep ocean]QKU34530.1 threonyl-tRNA synthetase [Tupanvirus deep ocean]